jgi:hypothetical protein
MNRVRMDWLLHCAYGAVYSSIMGVLLERKIISASHSDEYGTWDYNSTDSDSDFGNFDDGNSETGTAHVGQMPLLGNTACHFYSTGMYFYRTQLALP